MKTKNKKTACLLCGEMILESKFVDFIFLNSICPECFNKAKTEHKEKFGQTLMDFLRENYETQA